MLNVAESEMPSNPVITDDLVESSEDEEEEEIEVDVEEVSTFLVWKGACINDVTWRVLKIF
jgi:hypothetical protein